MVRNQDIKTLQSVTETYKTSINQLLTIKAALEKMVELLKNEQRLVKDSNLQQRFLQMQKTASLRLVEIIAQEKALQTDLELKQQQLKKQLSVRQGLTQYHLDSWPAIINQIALIPAKFYNYLKFLSYKVKDNYLWQIVWSALLCW